MHLSFQSLSGTGRREWPPPLEVTGVVLAVRCCIGVVPLQPDVSRRLTAEGECVTGASPPQCVGGVAWLTPAAEPPERGGSGAPTVGGTTPGEDRSAAWARWMDEPPW